MPIHDTTGVTDALMSGGFAGLSLLTSCTSIDGTASYSYDPTGQLIRARYSSSNPQSPIPNPSESYSYDANGNRTSVVTGSPTSVAAGLPTEPQTATYVTGPDNQLVSDGTYWYAYDPEGNRTARWIDVDQNGLLDSGDADITQYAWDARNRLTEVSHFADFASLGESDPDSIVDYLYDAENRWIGRDIDSDGDGQIDHQTRFAYDGNQIVLQFDKDLVGGGQHGAANQLTVASLSHRYLWQPDAVDQLMADEQLLSSPEGGEGQGGNGRDKGYDLSQPGEVVWPLTDHLGTIRDLAVHDAESGVTSVANHRVFDSFGNLKSQTNAAVDCVFAFTGRPLDEATELQNNLHRWYDAKVGRWISKDPIGFEGRDTNTNGYVGNSPQVSVDPSGLEPPPGAGTLPSGKSVPRGARSFDQQTGRPLTKKERKFFKFIFTSALPDVSLSIIEATLNEIRIHEGSGTNGPGHDPYTHGTDIYFARPVRFKGPGGEPLNQLISVLGHEVMHALSYRRSGLSEFFFDLAYTLEWLFNDAGYRGTFVEMFGYAMGATIVQILDRYGDLPDEVEAGIAEDRHPTIRQEIQRLFEDNLRIQFQWFRLPPPAPR